MAALAQALSAAQRQEQLAAQVAAENALIQRLSIPRPPELTDQDRLLLKAWFTWCAQRNVRHCPARPAIVAVFISEIAHMGDVHALAMLDAIANLHHHHSLANPCATFAVREALKSIIKDEPPRAWPKACKEAFVTLPAEIRAAISKLEKSRETEVRRLQNRTAEAIKSFTNSAKALNAVDDSADKKSVELKEKV